MRSTARSACTPALTGVIPEEIRLYLFTEHFKASACCRCCSVAQSCPTLSDSMDCSTPGFPVLYFPVLLNSVVFCFSCLPIKKNKTSYYNSNEINNLWGFFLTTATKMCQLPQMRKLVFHWWTRYHYPNCTDEETDPENLSNMPKAALSAGLGRSRNSNLGTSSSEPELSPLCCSVSLGLSELGMSATARANHSFTLLLPHSNNSNC